MKNRYLQLFANTAILSTLLFTGCGGVSDASISKKQPHDTSKLNRTVSIEKDWTWNVGFDENIMNSRISFKAHFWGGVPDAIENFQIFIDSDLNQDTGYSGSGGWEINGADFIIEDYKIYKSMSKTDWKWDLLGSVQNINFEKVSGLGKYEVLNINNFSPKLNEIFNSNKFRVMIEAYDANWEGNYPTITGIETDFTGVSIQQKIANDIKNRYININPLISPLKENIVYKELTNDFIITAQDTSRPGIPYKNNIISLYDIEDNGDIKFISDLLYRHSDTNGEFYELKQVQKNENTISFDIMYSSSKDDDINKKYQFNLNDIDNGYTFSKDETADGKYKVNAPFIELIQEI